MLHPRKTSWFLLAAAALAGCAQNSMEAGADPAAMETSAFRAIETEADFRETVVGKRLTYNETRWITVMPDGTFDGDFDGATPSGAWTWRDGQFCRGLAIGAEVVPYLCQTVEVSDQHVRTTWPDGTVGEVAFAE